MLHKAHSSPLAYVSVRHMKSSPLSTMWLYMRRALLVRDCVFSISMVVGDRAGGGSRIPTQGEMATHKNGVEKKIAIKAI